MSTYQHYQLRELESTDAPLLRFDPGQLKKDEEVSDCGSDHVQQNTLKNAEQKNFWKYDLEKGVTVMRVPDYLIEVSSYDDLLDGRTFQVMRQSPHATSPEAWSGMEIDLLCPFSIAFAKVSSTRTTEVRLSAEIGQRGKH